MTCFQRANWPSTRALSLYPLSRCQAIRPFSAIAWMWPSRWVGSVSAVALSTASTRGGTTTVASGWCSSRAVYTPVRSEPPSPRKSSTGSAIWSSRGSTCEASSTSRSVRMEATIRPVTASKPMCNLRHDRRLRVPCFSTSHSPGPPSFSPELSTSRWIGPPVEWGCAGIQALSAPAEGGEIGHRQVEAEQLEDRADQSLGLAQRQMEHRAQGQSCRDCQVRVVRLTAWRGPRRGFPGGDRLIREPHGQTAPLPQRLVIRCPIRHASLRPRNVVAAVGIVFVRHDGEIRMAGTVPLLRHLAHPCNTLPDGRRRSRPHRNPHDNGHPRRRMAPR